MTAPCNTCCGSCPECGRPLGARDPWLPVGVRPTEPSYYWILRPDGDADEYPIMIVKGNSGVLWVRDAFLRELGSSAYDACRFAPATPPALPTPAEEMAAHLDGLRDPGVEVAPLDLVAVLDEALAVLSVEAPAALFGACSALRDIAATAKREEFPALRESARQTVQHYCDGGEPWQRRIAAIFAGEVTR